MSSHPLRLALFDSRWSTQFFPYARRSCPLKLCRRDRVVFLSSDSRPHNNTPTESTALQQETKTSTQSSTPDKDHISDQDYEKDAAQYDAYISSVQSNFRSVRSSFYTYTSRRAQRRRAYVQHRQSQARKRLLRQSSGISKQEDEEDTRTIQDLVFPNPYKGEPLPNSKRWPRTTSEWIKVLSKTWSDYVWTWRGFWTSSGFLVEDPADQAQPTETPPKEAGSTVQENVQQNTEFLKTEAKNIKDQVQAATGIYTVDDLRRVAGQTMQLATECVKEFMQGYRKGRDEEVDKMLHEYFTDLKETVQKELVDDGKRRRRRKRRIRNKLHPAVLRRRKTSKRA